MTSEDLTDACEPDTDLTESSLLVIFRGFQDLFLHRLEETLVVELVQYFFIDKFLCFAASGIGATVA